jgi:hypothetical protein
LGGPEGTLGSSVAFNTCAIFFVGFGWGPKDTFFRPEVDTAVVGATAIVVLVRSVIGLGNFSKTPKGKMVYQHTGYLELWMA